MAIISYSTVSPTSSSNNGSIVASVSGGTPPLIIKFLHTQQQRVDQFEVLGSYTLYVMDQNFVSHHSLLI